MQNWEEAESIELTQWVKRVSKHIKSLPKAATKAITGKSLNQVLFDTSTLRHSAVHRLPTSANGILNMVTTAVSFAEALNDDKRAAKIEKIKQRLSAKIGDIVQHQTLLERKLSDELEDLGRRRAEIDASERQAIDDVLKMDKAQRAEAGLAVENILSNVLEGPRFCTCAQDSATESPEDDVKPENYSDAFLEGGITSHLQYSKAP